MSPETLKAINSKIKKDFPDAVFNLSEFKRDGEHYLLEIKSAKFQDLSLLNQHRLVNDSLKDYLASGELHALKLKTTTP